MWAKRFLNTVFIATTTFISIGALAAPAHALSAEESGLVALANRARAARGLHELVVRADLVLKAEAHSKKMASDGVLGHSSLVSFGASVLAENVGKGPGIAEVHDAFMSSAMHRGNILNLDYDEVGVGVFAAGGAVWVTELFGTPVQSGTHKPSAKPKGTSDSKKSPKSDAIISTAAAAPVSVTKATKKAPATVVAAARKTSSPARIPGGAARAADPETNRVAWWFANGVEEGLASPGTTVAGPQAWPSSGLRAASSALGPPLLATAALPLLLPAARRRRPAISVP
jgi:hypothetical protein